MLVERGAPSGSHLDDRDDELPRADVARSDELIRGAAIALERFGFLPRDDLHGSAAVCKARGAFGVSDRRVAAQGVREVGRFAARWSASTSSPIRRPISSRSET